MDKTSTIVADLNTAHCVYMHICLYENEYSNILASHMAVSSRFISVCRMFEHFEMRTTRPPTLAMCACKVGGGQPVSWASLCLDTAVKQRHNPVDGEVMAH